MHTLDEDEEATNVNSKAAVRGLVDQVEQADKQCPYLIVVSGEASVGKMFKLEREMVIGRSANADIQLDDDSVSRSHARIAVLDDGKVEITDLRSTNGIFYKGQRVERQLLHDGDKVEVGDITVALLYQEAVDEALQKNLFETATQDRLTRVYNKKYFVDALEKEFAYCQRHNVPLSLVVFEVDEFEQVRENEGPRAGNFVLRRLARLVSDYIEIEDTLARLGEADFGLLLREVSAERGATCARWIRRAVETVDFTFGMTRIPVTVSVGMVTSTDGTFESAQDFLKAAQNFLAQAKARGHNRVEARMISGL